MVDFTFLFGALRKFGFPEKFIEMTKMLFKDAFSTVKINGSQIRSLELGGCDARMPTGSLYFFSSGKSYECHDKAQVNSRIVKGINLPSGAYQQVIIKYANDSSLTLRGEEESVQGVIYTLDTSCVGLRLVFNWKKSY
jgi:hypothetical protein